MCFMLYIFPTEHKFTRRSNFIFTATLCHVNKTVYVAPQHLSGQSQKNPNELLAVIQSANCTVLEMMFNFDCWLLLHKQRFINSIYSDKI